MEEELRQLTVVLTGHRGRTAYQQVRTETGWDEDRFKDIRRAAQAAGLVQLGRGRGGIISLTQQAAENVTPELASEEVPPPESAYYEAIAEVMRTSWAESEEVDDHYVEITANRRRKGSGRWTVPDLTFFGRRVWRFVPSMDFFIQTIEVKRYEAADETAVFEALSHNRAVHQSYLILVNIPEETDEVQTKLLRLRTLCEEHNIGLVEVPAGGEGNFEKWDFTYEPDSEGPSPFNQDTFVKQFISEAGKEKISKMVR